jgi:hypothetical protein
VARPVDIPTLMTRVRRRADIESATARFPDEEVLDAINQASAYWYDLIVATPWGGTTYYRQFMFGTTSQLPNYPLPPDWLHNDGIDTLLAPALVNGVYTPNLSTQVLTALPYQAEFRNAFRFWNVAWNYNQPIFYRVQGQFLNLIPIPPGQFSVCINYIPIAPTLGGAGAVTVTSSGNGYSSPPAVTLTGGGGSGATAVAAVAFGGVTNVAIANAGSGYTSAPTVAFTGGGGSGAAATAIAVVTLDTINGWDEALVLRAARTLLLKDGDAATNEIAQLTAVMNEEESRIRSAAGVRDRNRGEVVHDVVSDMDEGWWP